MSEREVNTLQCCDVCSQVMSIHQPDPTRPDQLVKVCSTCNHWIVTGHAYFHGWGPDSFHMKFDAVPSAGG